MAAGRELEQEGQRGGAFREEAAVLAGGVISLSGEATFPEGLEGGNIILA